MPKLNWDRFCNKPAFRVIQKDVEVFIGKLEIEIENVYEQCEEEIELIKGINNLLAQNCSAKITETDFSGDFLASYRQSTAMAYFNVRKKFK